MKGGGFSLYDVNWQTRATLGSHLPTTFYPSLYSSIREIHVQESEKYIWLNLRNTVSIILSRAVFFPSQNMRLPLLCSSRKSRINMVEYGQAHFSKPTESISETDQLTFTFDIFEEISYFQEKFKLWVNGKNFRFSAKFIFVENFQIFRKFRFWGKCSELYPLHKVGAQSAPNTSNL